MKRPIFSHLPWTAAFWIEPQKGAFMRHEMVTSESCGMEETELFNVSREQRLARSSRLRFGNGAYQIW
jgi:hypothetical protein